MCFCSNFARSPDWESSSVGYRRSPSAPKIFFAKIRKYVIASQSTRHLRNSVIKEPRRTARFVLRTIRTESAEVFFQEVVRRKHETRIPSQDYVRTKRSRQGSQGPGVRQWHKPEASSHCLCTGHRRGTRKAQLGEEPRLNLYDQASERHQVPSWRMVLRYA